MKTRETSKRKGQSLVLSAERKRMKHIIACGFLIVILSILSIFIRNRMVQAGNVSEKYYRSIEIHAGDSLWSIAKEYRTDEYATVSEYIEEVKKINHLEGDRLYTGRSICIPYYQKTERGAYIS